MIITQQPTMLITGGSRGIGAAIARLAVKRGYQVAINYRGNQHAADKLVEELSTLNGEVFAIQADVANEAEVKKLFAACDKQWKYITVLVNNAGIVDRSIRPGIIDTEIHASGGEPDRANRLASAIPMNRPGTATEVANAVLWLASDEASYVTGSLLNVSGGR